MRGDQDTNKQRLIVIVGIFLVIIFVGWLWSLNWVLLSNESGDGQGTVKEVVGGIEDSLATFNKNISAKKTSINNVVQTLRDRLDKEKETADLVTESLKDKITAISMESWNEYSDENTYFKYPLDWTLSADNNVLSLMVGGVNSLSIVTYASASDLPDNINSLQLIPWLDEQVDRELGIYSGYELTSLSNEYEMYQVDSKGDMKSRDIYWQKDNTVFHMNYVLNEELDKMIKLIISTIK